MWKFHIQKKLAITSIILGLLPWYAHAQEIGVQNNIINTFLPLLSIIYSFVIYLMFWGLKLITTLLDPTFILRISGNNDGVLLEIWQFSRDIVNILFALILAAAAFYAVLKADTSIIKSNINKFILAIILVNFSWFGPRLVLDFANVATAAIYALPSAMQECSRPSFPGDILNPTGSTKCWKIIDVIPYDAKEAEAASRVPAGSVSQLGECFKSTTTPTTGASTQYIVVGDNICLVLNELKINEAAGAEIMQGLLVNFTNIIYAGRLPSNFPTPTAISSPDQLGDLAQFLIKLLLNFSLSFAVAVPLLAMSVIFFVRMFILWITIAFMPFAFIGFLIGNIEMGNLTDIWMHFWKNALLPAVLAVPFAIGFIMINGLANETCPFASDPVHSSLCDQLKIPIIGINSWWHVIWYTMALMVIYTGFFMATKFDRIAEKIGSVFKGWGDFALKAPLGIPLPIGPNGASIRAIDAIRPPDPFAIGNKGNDVNNKLKNNSFEGQKLATDAATISNNIDEVIRKTGDAEITKLQELIDAFKQSGSKTDFDKLQAHGKNSNLNIDINSNTIEHINNKLNNKLDSAQLAEVQNKMKKFE